MGVCISKTKDFAEDVIDNIDEIISGCTDSKAKNYDPNALTDSGNCIYHNLPGGIDIILDNYQSDTQEIDVLFKYMVENEPSSELYGFQFYVAGAEVTGAYGGAVEETDFFVSVGTNVVLGFSLTGDSIDVHPNPMILTTLTLIDVSDEICLNDIVLSAEGGGAHIHNLEYCFKVK